MAEITRDVLIVGAGAAGLTAANDLRKAGLSVAVLEARDRVGGRLWTDVIDGAMLELGGQWVSPDQDALIDTIDELGLETYSRYREGDSVYVGPDGQVARASPARCSRCRPRPRGHRRDHRAPRRDGRRDRPRPPVGAPERRGVGLDHVGRLAARADRRRRGRAEPRVRHGVGDAHQAHALVLAAAVAADGRIRRVVLEPRRRRLHPRPARRRRTAAGAAAARRAPRRRRAPEPAGALARVERRRRHGDAPTMLTVRGPLRDPRARTGALQPHRLRAAAAAPPAPAAPAPLDGLRDQGARRLRPPVLARAGAERHRLQPVRARRTRRTTTPTTATSAAPWSASSATGTPTTCSRCRPRSARSASSSRCRTTTAPRRRTRSSTTRATGAPRSGRAARTPRASTWAACTATARTCARRSVRSTSPAATWRAPATSTSTVRSAWGTSSPRTSSTRAGQPATRLRGRLMTGAVVVGYTATDAGADAAALGARLARSLGCGPASRDRAALRGHPQCRGPSGARLRGPHPSPGEGVARRRGRATAAGADPHGSRALRRVVRRRADRRRRGVRRAAHRRRYRRRRASSDATASAAWRPSCCTRRPSRSRSRPAGTADEDDHVLPRVTVAVGTRPGAENLLDEAAAIATDVAGSGCASSLSCRSTCHPDSTPVRSDSSATSTRTTCSRSPRGCCPTNCTPTSRKHPATRVEDAVAEPLLAPRRGRPRRLQPSGAAAPAVPGLHRGEDAARAARPDDRRPAHPRRSRSPLMSSSNRATEPASGVTTGISQQGAERRNGRSARSQSSSASRRIAPAYTLTAAVGPTRRRRRHRRSPRSSCRLHPDAADRLRLSRAEQPHDARLRHLLHLGRRGRSVPGSAGWRGGASSSRRPRAVQPRRHRGRLPLPPDRADLRQPRDRRISPATLIINIVVCLLFMLGATWCRTATCRRRRSCSTPRRLPGPRARVLRRRSRSCRP